jgi:mgtE-like transporter
MTPTPDRDQRRPLYPRAMFAYWRAERSTLRQGMVSLSISGLGNIPTGLALGAMSGRLEELPGLFILIPAAIGMRGAIFGALGSRFGSALQAGLDLSWTPGGRLRQNVAATLSLALASSLFLAVVARAVTTATGLPSIDIWSYTVISVLGGIISGVIILGLTLMLARAGAQRGWDLDSVASPMITFMGDLVTLPALFLASLLAGLGTATTVVGMLCAVVCVVAGVIGWLAPGKIARRIVRESAVTLMLSGIVNALAGALLEHRQERFFTHRALLVMLPAFLENAGALGGIVSSRLASKLHLGAIRPRVLPERLAALDISLAGPWSVLNFALTGATAHIVARALDFPSPGLAQMTLIALVGGALATIGAAIVAYATAVATFRFDLDPDNHGIAAVTSTMDLVGVVCLLAGAALVGVT